MSDTDTVYYEDAFGRIWVRSDPDRLTPTHRPRRTASDGIQYEWARCEGIDDLEDMGLVPGRWHGGLRPWRRGQMAEAQGTIVHAIQAATGRDIAPALEWDGSAVTLSIGEGYALKIHHGGEAFVEHERDPLAVAGIGHGEEGLYLRFLHAEGLKDAVTTMQVLHRAIGLTVRRSDIEAELRTLHAEMVTCLDDIANAASAVSVDVSGALAGAYSSVNGLNLGAIADMLLAAIVSEHRSGWEAM